MFLPHATYTPSQGPGKCHRITEAAQNPESHQLNQVQLWMRLFGYSSLSTAAWVELLLAWETKETGFLPHLHLTYSGRTGIGHSSSNGENGRHKGVISPWQFWNWAGKCCIFLIRSQGLGSLSMVLPYLLGSWFHPLGDPHYFIFCKNLDSVSSHYVFYLGWKRNHGNPHSVPWRILTTIYWNGDVSSDWTACIHESVPRSIWLQVLCMVLDTSLRLPFLTWGK